MTKLKITVTKEILEESKMCGKGENYPAVSENCAIALAVRDIFPTARVGFSAIIFDWADYKQYALLPKVASDFINNFDCTSPDFRPDLPEISFEVEVPDEVIDKINIEELRPLLANHPNLALM